MIKNLVQIGEQAEHRGIVVTPLFPCRDPVAAYVTLDEALASGLRIRETSESGSVPELLVENALAERVLLYDGEELVGAKQNRILKVSVLVEARSMLTIPVSRVEQGRWRDVSTAFSSGSHISHAELRRRKAVCLDAVSHPHAFAQLWPKLRAGYLLDALERLDGKATSRGEIEGLLADAERVESSRQPSAGLGEDVRRRGESVIGSGLELEGELIQLSAFRSEDGGRRAFGRIARPSRRR